MLQWHQCEFKVGGRTERDGVWGAVFPSSPGQFFSFFLWSQNDMVNSEVLNLKFFFIVSYLSGVRVDSMANFGFSSKAMNKTSIIKCCHWARTTNIGLLYPKVRNNNIPNDVPQTKIVGCVPGRYDTSALLLCTGIIGSPFIITEFFYHTIQHFIAIYNDICTPSLYGCLFVYTLCLKKSMWRYLFEHNSNINWPIIIIFGTVVTETISYWIGVSFFHLTYFVHLHYLGNHTTWKFANSAINYCKQTHLNNMLVTLEFFQSKRRSYQQPQTKPCWLQDLGSDAAACVRTSYEQRRWAEAAPHCCLGWYTAERHRLGCRWMAKATQSMCACRGSAVRTLFMIFCWIERTRV